MCDHDGGDRETGVEGRSQAGKVTGARSCVIKEGSINSKLLLYSMGKYIQYPIINHNEKNMKKCITESQWCKTEINTTL